MSMSDPLGDMLTRIRNAQRARHSTCVAPASRLRANVLDVLKREGFIRGFADEQLRPGVAQLRIELKYDAGEPVIKEISRISKPGRRVYSRIKELPRVYAGLGDVLVCQHIPGRVEQPGPRYGIPLGPNPEPVDVFLRAGDRGADLRRRRAVQQARDPSLALRLRWHTREKFPEEIENIGLGRRPFNHHPTTQLDDVCAPFRKRHYNASAER